MNKKFFFLVLFLSLPIVIGFSQSTNYTSNRAPLSDNPFIALPMGSITPQGWLKEQLVLQKKGLTGNSETIYHELNSNSAWLGGNESDSDWERPPYYIKGLINLAYTLNDNELKVKAQKWIDWTLNSQRENGDFGPTTLADWWPKMLMLTTLMDYYEATLDDRVVPFLTNYFQYQLNTLETQPLFDWAQARASDNAEVVFWLYNITGNTFLLNLADLIKSQAYDYSDIFNNNNLVTQNYFQFYHSVNVAQALKYGPVFYQKSQSVDDRDSFSEGVDFLQRDHGHITGINSGTEFISGNSSVQGVELCATVERIYSNQVASRVFANASSGDNLEKIAFNQLAGSVSADFKQLQYYTQPNQVQNKIGHHGFGQDYINSVVPGPYSGFPCCRFNLHMGWPKYAQYAWMATNDNGLVAVSYAPSTVTAKVADNIEVIIKEATNYPFEEQITFTITTSQAVTFPLKLRIPEWCNSPVVRVNGTVQSGVTSGSYYSINRLWNNGDVVVLEVPMHIETSTWVNNSIGIERGPLVFSLEMHENWQSKTAYNFNGILFDEFEVFPLNSWNYGLVVDRNNPSASITVEKRAMPVNPFVSSTTPIRLLVKAKKIPSWGLDFNGIHASEPPYSPVASNEAEENIYLVPFGAEQIRVSYFPEIAVEESDPVDVYSENFTGDDLAKTWVSFAGGWQPEDGGILHADSYGLGGIKYVNMGTDYDNVSTTVDLSINNDGGQAGIIIRGDNFGIGADNLNGYYAGLNQQTGEVILGRFNNNTYTQLAQTPISIDKNRYYTLNIVARESNIKVYIDDLNTPLIDINDDFYSKGSVGLRCYGGKKADFKNFSANRILEDLTVFKGCDYLYESTRLELGSYPLLDDFDNQISSIKIPAGYKYILYEDENFTGASIELTANESCLSTIGWDNRVSSIKVGRISLQGIYYLQNKSSQLFMQVAGGTSAQYNGANIQQGNLLSKENQQFELTHQEDDYYKITIVSSDKSLDISGESTTNGTNVDQWDYLGIANQKFKILPTSTDYYKILPSHAEDKFIEVGGCEAAEGANIQIWTDQDQPCGEWRLIPVEEKINTIQNILSTEALESTNKKVKLYPNPANNSFVTISGLNEDETTTIKIMDILGHTFITEEIHSNTYQVDIKSLKSQLYFINISSKGGVKIKKLLVN